MRRYGTVMGTKFGGTAAIRAARPLTSAKTFAASRSAIRRTGSLRIAASDEEVADCEQHLAALCGDGFPAERYEGSEGRGLLVPTDCAFDPLRRCATLACRAADAGALLFEQSPAVAIESGDVRTGEGRVRCERVVIAVDGRLADVVPSLAPRIRPDGERRRAGAG